MANVTTKVDLVINRLSQQKYDQLSAAGLLNPNQLYVTSGGADAVLETRLVAGKALSADVTAADISSAIDLDQYLTAVPAAYKTYDEAKQSLSSDGYATQGQLNAKSAVSVDGEHADVNMVHISLDDYNEKLVGDEILSNELYVISSDYVETYGQQIKNVAEPTDLSDAATKGYVDSNFQPAGNYLTAVPSDYKTYAATLSSLSSTYSLTSHNHDSAYKPKQAAVPSPTASGSTASFIDTITQDANGVITTTKKSVLSATTSQAGIVQLNDTLTSTSTTQAATANAVKSLNDNALHKTGDETAVGQKTFSDAFTVGTRKSGTIGTKSFTYGLNNLASGEGSLAGGQNCVASEAYAVAEGYQTSALGLGAHAEGQNTLAKGGSYCSHAEGYKTVALNGYAHAEGYETSADYMSHAEGNHSFAYSMGHAEGDGTYAYGYASHAENGQTSALNNHTHAEGMFTLAQNTYEHAQGTYNFSNAGNQLSSQTIDSIGIGTNYTARKNATEVMQNGDAYFLGVGGYDGTNAASATSKPLAAVLSAKVDIDSLGYALSTVIGTLSSGSYVYDVTDRTMTTIGINQSTTPVIVRLPDAGNGARDFILRIEISSETAPTFTFANTAGLDFESEDDDWAIMQPGVNLISFTETKR